MKSIISFLIVSVLISFGYITILSSVDCLPLKLDGFNQFQQLTGINGDNQSSISDKLSKILNLFNLLLKQLIDTFKNGDIINMFGDLAQFLFNLGA